MAIFTAEEFGSAIENCWLDGEIVTHLATCAAIDSVSDAMPLFSSKLMMGTGWVDLLDTTNKGYPHFIVDDDNKPVVTRHYGIVQLDWRNA